MHVIWGGGYMHVPEDEESCDFRRPYYVYCTNLLYRLCIVNMV